MFLGTIYLIFLGIYLHLKCCLYRTTGKMYHRKKCCPCVWIKAEVNLDQSKGGPCRQFFVYIAAVHGGEYCRCQSFGCWIECQWSLRTTTKCPLVALESWLLARGSLLCKIGRDCLNVVVDWSWLVNRGGCSDSFDCTCNVMWQSCHCTILT